jgi:predicted methyltransferase
VPVVLTARYVLTAIVLGERAMRLVRRVSKWNTAVKYAENHGETVMLVTKGNEHTEEFRGKFQSESDCASCKSKYAQEIRKKLEKDFLHKVAAGQSKKSLVLNGTGIESYEWWQEFWSEL